MRLFSKLGEYNACGMFSIGHLILLSVTIVGIVTALHYTLYKGKKEIKNIIKNCTIFLWGLEIIKIVFNLWSGNANNPNTYIPLYFCSLILYTGLMSAFGKGTIKKVGDIFLATGGIIAGASFMLVPLTSLTNYPMWHFISIQSFVLHGTMVYLGVLINLTDYIEYNKSDIKYYFSLIIFLGIIAYIVNLILGTNFMFISQNFPNTPIEIIYNITGSFFPLVMLLGQAILQFYIIYFIKEKLPNECKEELIENIEGAVR